jgi:tryptophan synthase alpha chain
VNRIDRTFKVLKLCRRKALIGYVTAGFPTKASLLTLVPLLEKSGLDLLELGVPFSDPIADGPTIQHSSQLALENGVTLEWVLKSARQLRQKGVKLPLIFMSYCNPIHTMGVDLFFQKAAACGVDGLIIPDMIPEEADVYERSARKRGIDLIYLVSPTTPRARARMIVRRTNGFLYAVSLTGVTGTRKALPIHAATFLKSIKKVCRKPVAVGFGLSTPQQVHDISKHADGVIVGSALIREIERSKRTSFKGAAAFVKSLRRALDKENTHAS